MTNSARTRSAALAAFVVSILALGADPATSATMTFKDMDYDDDYSYSEDGITALFSNSAAQGLGEIDGYFLFYPWYGTSDIVFTMAETFSAKSLDLGGAFRLIDCFVSSAGSASSCKPSSFGEGVSLLNVSGSTIDGQSVHATFAQGVGTLLLGSEFSNLSFLSVSLAYTSDLLVQTPVPIPSGLYVDWGVPYLDGGPSHGLMRDADGNYIRDENGNYLYHEGIYTFADCDKNCFVGRVDNVVLTPTVEVAPVPLPATVFLSSFGLFALALVGKHRRRVTPLA